MGTGHRLLRVAVGIHYRVASRVGQETFPRCAHQASAREAVRRPLRREPGAGREWAVTRPAPRPAGSASGSRRRLRRPRPYETSWVARRHAAARWTVPRPAGRRAGGPGWWRSSRVGVRGRALCCPASPHVTPPRLLPRAQRHAPRAGAQPLFGSALLRDLNFPQRSERGKIPGW